MIFYEPQAGQDIRRVWRWYRRIRRPLGLRFLRELENTFQRIEQFPQAAAVLGADVRAVRLRKFPYVVYYRVDRSYERVIAVIHERRHPRVWRRRLTPPDAPSE